MQVILQPVLSSEGGSVEVDTNSKAVLSSLISSYCAQKGVKYDGKYTIYDEKKRPLPLYSTLSALGIENGQTLLIGKEDSSFNVLKQWPIVVALATIAIGLIGILTISLVYGLKGGEYFDDYGVVMDAGSSKTNTIVYKWKSNKFKGTGKVSQEGNCFAEGGIAKMNPMHLESVIECANNVTSFIAPKSLTKTPLFFAATAGMRLLNITDPSRVEEIIDQLKLQLPDTNLDVKSVEIISGSDEGIYGWITSNFLLKTLEEPQQMDPWEPTTYGALDLGGASTQISYAVDNNRAENNSEVLKMQLYGQTYNVFAQSNLCFGRDEAQNRYQTLLLRKRNGTVIADPCVPKGFVKNVTAAKLFQSICANYELEKDPLLNDPSKFQNINFTYVGTSDPVSCNQSVSDLLNVELCNDLNFIECFKKHTDIPVNQMFTAFAGYFYTTFALEITNVTLKEYEETVVDFCKKDLNEVEIFTNYSHFGPQYCFNGHYIHQILTNGFGFSSDTWKNLNFVGKISGKDVGWTLGYMINATKIIPEKATPRLISARSLTVSLVLFILIIVATAIFLLYAYKKNSSSSTSPC